MIKVVQTNGPLKVNSKSEYREDGTNQEADQSKGKTENPAEQIGQQRISGEDRNRNIRIREYNET